VLVREPALVPEVRLLSSTKASSKATGAVPVARPEKTRVSPLDVASIPAETAEAAFGPAFASASGVLSPPPALARRSFSDTSSNDNSSEVWEEELHGLLTWDDALQSWLEEQGGSIELFLMPVGSDNPLDPVFVDYTY